MTSQTLFQLAQQYIPGGVNSPVRAFKAVGGNPIFFDSAEGPYMIDHNGDRYIDYIGSWGPMILGHGHPHVLKAIRQASSKAISFGAPCALEVDMAKKLCESVPSIERVRMMNSGTEAAMTALRLARGFTKRSKIVKFSGGYHGHSDPLLVKAGSGPSTLGIPDSAGIPAEIAGNTLSLPFNDLGVLREVFSKVGEQIAAVIVEPISANMNVIAPRPGFLAGLRQICDEYGALLIFDEVITGFRVALGGAQSLFGVMPDLTVLGKIIGGGLPVGAVGGRQDVMEYLAPLGPVYQAGTLSGNPVVMAAGLATLDIVSEPGFYTKLAANTKAITHGLKQAAADAEIDLQLTEYTGLFGLIFTDQKHIENYEQMQACDHQRYRTFFHAMLNNHIYFAPSSYEAVFVSIAHDADSGVADATTKSAELIFEILANAN